MIIKNKKIGSGEKTFVIAEMAWSHDGSVEKAKKIIKGAADAGADAISVHITNMEDYMCKDYGCKAGQTISAGKGKELSIYEYLDSINIREKDWEELFPYAKNLGLIICAMCNDMKSLRLCEKLDPEMYVVASSCFLEENLVVGIAKQKKPVVLRIGGASLGEIENTINLIKRQGNENIILLHGIQSYPTKIEDNHLNLIPSLKEIFGLPVGLADHVDAESELALIVPLVSIPLGACVIEKHITYDRSVKGEDFEAALNPDEFKKLVGYIREIEKSLGSSHFRDFSEAELKYRKVSRKRTVAFKDINKGEKITMNNITFKRCDDGVYPDEIKSFIGRTVKNGIKKDEPITIEKVL